MSPRLVRAEWRVLKQVLHTTQALKYGKICPITLNAIFGRWVVCCMRCVLSVLHLLPTISTAWKKELLQVIMIGYHNITLKIFRILLDFAWLLIPSKDHQLRHYFKALILEKGSIYILMKDSMKLRFSHWWIRRINYCKLLEFPINITLEVI